MRMCRVLAPVLSEFADGLEEAAGVRRVLCCAGWVAGWNAMFRQFRRVVQLASVVRLNPFFCFLFSAQLVPQRKLRPSHAKHLHARAPRPTLTPTTCPQKTFNSLSSFRHIACPDLTPFVKRLLQQLSQEQIAVKDVLEYVMFAAYECPVASLGNDRV